MEDCIFCKIIIGEIPAKILAQDELVTVIMSLENHPLILTKKHYENIYSLDDESAAAVMQMAVKVANAVKSGLGAEGITVLQNNEAVAGQDVFHYHMHIKPRWSKDEEQKKKDTFEKIKEAL